MGLFGSLVTSASALHAQSQSTASISTNIANVNTIGFKRSDTVFKELVTSDGRFSPFTPAAVQATQVQRISQPGNIQQTQSSTDSAIAGNGFFVVRNSLNESEPFSYTRNGNFGTFAIRSAADTDPLATENAGEQSVLRNSAGYFLYGYPIDSEGNVSGAGTFSGLTPVVVTADQTLARQTTQAQIAFNLDAREAPTDPHTLPGGATQLPVTGLTAADFSRDLTVFDANGNGYNIDFQFRHIVGPMAHFTSSADGALELDDVLADPLNDGVLNGINAGDSFSIALSTGATETYTIVDPSVGNDLANNQIADVNGLIEAINLHGDGTELTANLNSEGRLIVRSNDLTGTITLNEVSGTPLSGLSTLNIIEDPDGPGDFTYEPDADPTANGVANPNQSEFPPLGNTADPNPFGWWEVSLFIPDPDPAALPGSPAVEVRKALLNFNGDGSLNVTPDANGNVEIDLSTNPIDFDLGSDDGLVNFNVDISGMSQFSSEYNVFIAEQNGADLGLLDGVSINSNGQVIASFSNGLLTPLYQLPIATFANADGLEAIDGTAFVPTNDSGVPTLNFAGEGGAGILDENSLEISNVELADEFAKLIVTQRSYSASSQVITAIDEMTSALAQLS